MPDSVDSVKYKLATKLGIAAAKVRLVYAGRELTGLNLEDYGLFRSPKSAPVIQLVESSSYRTVHQVDGTSNISGLEGLSKSLCPGGTTPAAGATEVDPDTTIELELSKLYAPKQCDQLARWTNLGFYPQTDLVTIENLEDDSPPVDAELLFQSGTLTIAPNEALDLDTTYMVTLKTCDLLVKECCTTRHLDLELSFSFKTADCEPRQLRLELVHADPSGHAD